MLACKHDIMQGLSTSPGSAAKQRCRIHLKNDMSLSTVDQATAKQYIMQDDDFEWRDEKAASNWLDH